MSFKQGLHSLMMALVVIIGYIVGLFLLSGFYYKNDNFLILWARVQDYLSQSWPGFVIACLVVAVFFYKKLGRSTSPRRLFFLFSLAALTVSFLTGLLFFIRVGVFTGSLSMDGGQWWSLLIYALLQSGLGVFYALPAILMSSYILTIMWRHQHNKV